MERVTLCTACICIHVQHCRLAIYSNGTTQSAISMLECGMRACSAVGGCIHDEQGTAAASDCGSFVASIEIVDAIDITIEQPMIPPMISHTSTVV